VIAVDGRSGRLISLATLPDKRGRGHARAMLLRSENEARRLGARSMMLEVRAANLPAINGYLSSGYAVRGTIADYYGPGMDALVMAKRL